MDPLAKTFPEWSPYVYTFNNPVRFTDPDGRKPNDWVKDSWGWHWRSDVTSAKQAKNLGYSAYSNGRGDKNSIYYTTLGVNGRGTGANHKIVLGENGNYTNNGVTYNSPDQAPYVDSKEVDKVEKILVAPLYGVMAAPAVVYEWSALGSVGGSTTYSILGDVTIGRYLQASAIRGVMDVSAQAYFKNRNDGKSGFENVDIRQLGINAFVGSALPNFLLNTANNFWGSRKTFWDDAPVNTVKIFTGAFGNATGNVGTNIVTKTILPSVYMNGTDQILYKASEKYKNDNK